MSNILNGLAFPEVLWPSSRGETPTEEDNDSIQEDQDPESPDRIFHKFVQLPPEIRHKIWRTAVPSPGINFFNIHCFPGDHEGTNRSDSPPWLYLDMRRMSIHDDDDAVYQYDPSVWQARAVLRQVSREARAVLTIPDDKLATVTLTQPKSGLYIEAGDGKLRTLTPEHRGQIEKRREFLDQPEKLSDHDLAVVIHEPVVRRTIQLHKDDIFCLSIENCSLNLPHEEDPGDVDDLTGWWGDPQLEPLPARVPMDRFCFEMCRDTSANPSGTSIEIIEDIRRDIWARQLQASGWALGTPGDPDEEHTTHGVGKSCNLHNVPHMELIDIMLDTRGIEVGSREVEELTGKRRTMKKKDVKSRLLSMASNGRLTFPLSREEKKMEKLWMEEDKEVDDVDNEEVDSGFIYWDRFGDCYLSLPWKKEMLPGLHVGRCLTKVHPESNDIRMQYARSAQLKSSKRPAEW